MDSKRLRSHNTTLPLYSRCVDGQLTCPDTLPREGGWYGPGCEGSGVKNRPPPLPAPPPSMLPCSSTAWGCPCRNCSLCCCCHRRCCSSCSCCSNSCSWFKVGLSSRSAQTACPGTQVGPWAGFAQLQGQGILRMAFLHMCSLCARCLCTMCSIPGVARPAQRAAS